MPDEAETPPGPENAPEVMPLPTVMVPEAPTAAGPASPPAVMVFPAKTSPSPAFTVPAEVFSPTVTIWDVLSCVSAADAGAVVSAAATPAVSFPVPGADVSPAGSAPLATGPSA